MDAGGRARSGNVAPLVVIASVRLTRVGVGRALANFVRERLAGGARPAGASAVGAHTPIAGVGFVFTKGGARFAVALHDK